MRMWTLALMMTCLAALPGRAFEFASIDGGVIDLEAFKGRPVLVVNTASRCGYTDQLAGLQALHDTYGPRGLVVLAVPSGDFNQELATEAEVKAFCEVQYGLTLPMAQITPVRGAQAHPFYQWLQAEYGHAPRWNFNKALLDGDGALVAFHGANVRPRAQRLTRQIEAVLAP